ncbi:MAG: hypothetical protein J2P57_05855 [Acidimicrobiaceae bacterium]|nr:hypothetical protein [Acidimicrobiaceae bacterium]
MSPGKLASTLLAVVSIAASCSSGTHGARAAPPSGVYSRAAVFSGPITVGHVIEPEEAGRAGLPSGYVEQEFFASGTATALRGVSEPRDGRWTVKPSGAAPYETRILVRRPADPRRFNGTVVVEWLNVTAGESDPDWGYLNPELADAGYAYVGVSVQALGVEGGTGLLGTGASKGLIRSEPARYGKLHHPGDRFALDMFAQIGRGLRQNHAVLGGLQPKHIDAIGESQSAFFLTTFANALQPLTDAYDGLFIHSRGGAGVPLTGGSITSGASSSGQQIRTDLKVPVFMFETETDVAVLGYASARQPDTRMIRTWEVAGTAHADAYLVGSFANQLGCPKPINDGPQHEVVQAAFAWFTKWVADGKPPPSPSPLRLASSHPVKLALDANGNALGGVRTPAVDVPVSTLSGVPTPGGKPLCTLFGSTTAFNGSRLAALYHSSGRYLARYTTDLDRAIAGGYILASDRSELLQGAAHVQVTAG